ncbi:MAG: hypothetical protein ABI983_08465 [Acidobacteriota bacterium]
MARVIGTIAIAIALTSAVISAQALTAADAAAFMGSWTIALDSPQGNFEQTLVLKEDGGKVVGEISNQMAPGTQKVTDITKTGNDLVLKFAGDFQGNAFDATITMVPDGTDKAKVTFDVNGGQFTMSGTGVKK